MTKTQLKILNEIKTLKLSDYREIKEIELKDYKYFIGVFLTIGDKRKNDKNGYFLTRDNYSIRIGKRGKLTVERLRTNKKYNFLGVIY
jgi:hypothetical protein